VKKERRNGKPVHPGNRGHPGKKANPQRGKRESLGPPTKKKVWRGKGQNVQREGKLEGVFSRKDSRLAGTRGRKGGDTTKSKHGG